MTLAYTNPDVSEATVERIQEAIRVLEARGIAGATSVRALADLAGVGRATVYRAFSLRPGLFDHWSAARCSATGNEDRQCTEDLERRLRDANARIRSLEDQLDAYATALHALELDRRRLLKGAGAPVVPLTRGPERG